MKWTLIARVLQSNSKGTSYSSYETGDNFPEIQFRKGNFTFGLSKLGCSWNKQFY